jgi:pimeloyl-ACP methyl ester carboxylesterase
VLLIHGFASNKTVNWIGPGWVKTLGGAGYRVIAIDNRGHGESDKPHETEAYVPEKMAADAIALLDHLEIGRAHVMGYSMGARASVRSCRLPRLKGSVPSYSAASELAWSTGLADGRGIAEALLAPSIDEVTQERGRAFRTFADQTGSDRIALAACIESSRKKLTPEQVREISTPALIAVGTKDDIAGSASELADLLPDATVVDIPGRDHMLAVGDRVYKQATLDFFGAH